MLRAEERAHRPINLAAGCLIEIERAGKITRKQRRAAVTALCEIIDRLQIVRHIIDSAKRLDSPQQRLAAPVRHLPDFIGPKHACRNDS